MKYNKIANTELIVSNIIMGCMRLSNLSLSEIENLIRTAIDEGVNFFDHADIYGEGKCEELFAQAIKMKQSLREKIVIQSKCGIRAKGNYYDFSKKHIIHSVNGILKRLQTDYLDILILHRPDPLMDPLEVSEAFDRLHFEGKVKYFGVSNFNPAQIQLLQKHNSHKLVVNQLQFSLAHTPIIDAGITLNTNMDQSINKDSSVLEYCRLHDISLQAWSPFQKGFFEGTFLGDNETYPELNAVINKLAEKYDVSNTTIATAWITTHPADIGVVIGTTDKNRFREACKGSDLHLSREEWYQLYKASGNIVP